MSSIKFELINNEHMLWCPHCGESSLFDLSCFGLMEDGDYSYCPRCGRTLMIKEIYKEIHNEES